MNKSFIKKSITFMTSLFLLTASIGNTYAKTYLNNKTNPVATKKVTATTVAKSAAAKSVIVPKKTTTKYTNSYSALKNQKKTFSANRGSYTRYIDMKATAYTAGKGAYTASGLPAKVGNIAVDPKVIPLGTKLYIKSLDGSPDYGYAVAADTGGAIKNNIVDLFFNSLGECYQFGNRKVRVYILD